MSGLNLETDCLLQIACYITDHDMNVLEPKGFEAVIHREKSVLDAMDEWCTNTHGKTGLTQRVLESENTVSEVESKLLEYIKKHVPEPRKALLAGNSVHADKNFLMKEMPRIIEWLHYRILDVSTVKEGARRWCSDKVLRNIPKKLETHEARQDILESIEEMKYWKQTLFQK